tara:strand:- start:544 stop:1506 length:963 start_codon:yes stop_codon:yes gene_type:complete
MEFLQSMNSCELISKEYRSGFVALIGRPNVGKSTLVNKLVGEKVAITSPVSQTTRNRLKAIVTTASAQLVIVDTPGIHKPHHLLGERLVKSAKSAIGEVDIVLLLLEASSSPGRGDYFIVELLKQQKVPVLVALNKWDLVEEGNFEKRQNEYQDLFEKVSWPVYRCSALSGYGCNELIDVLFKKLPFGKMLYPENIVSDQPENILLAELIREQVLIHTREEIPHSVAVKIERIEEIPLKGKKDTDSFRTAVLATVLVERKSQKGILIGKKGSMLKKIGVGARLQMQTLINGSVYLELFVKVVPNWRTNPSRLSELGYEGH